MKLFVAPLQGYTEAPWRHAHALIYGHCGVPEYFTPFVRVEDGLPRRRDMRDVQSPLNESHAPTPQVIFRNIEELRLLVETIKETGCTKIDMNLGCPFPPQCRKGRGAAVVANTALLSEVARFVAGSSGIEFSIKMRLGLSLPDEWRNVIDIINSMPLRHITVHPRVAVQQYAGELHLAEFAGLLAMSAHPVVFNGDVTSLDDVKRLESTFPALHGVMIGRGVLARPSLVAEVFSGQEWNHDKRIAALRSFYAEVSDEYAGTLCGQGQYLSKIKPFWDYLEPEIGRKAWKSIKKSTDVGKYDMAVARALESRV